MFLTADLSIAHLTWALPLIRRSCGVARSRMSAAQAHVNLAGPCPEKLKRLQHGRDVPPLAVTADIGDELSVEL